MKATKMTPVAAALAATLAAAMGLAHAGEDGERSRAEVQAEVLVARHDGTLGVMAGEDSGSFYLSQHPQASAVTRGDVLAQAQAIRSANGRLHGGDSGTVVLLPQEPPSTLTRAEVVAEMLAERASGDIAASACEGSGSTWVGQHAPHHGAVQMAARGLTRR